jgi:predicted amidohydrolase
LKRALVYNVKAVDGSAQIVCFPETYPGPWKEPIVSFHEEMPAKAGGKGIYLICRSAEIVKEFPGRHYVVQILLDSEGKIAGKYRRTSPLGPWIYKKSRL